MRKKIIALLLALALVLTLCACGGDGEDLGGQSPDGSPGTVEVTMAQQAQEALRDASLAYNELATLINDNPGVADNATLAGAQAVSDALFEIKGVLETGGLSDELYGGYADRLKDLKAEADRLLGRMKDILDGGARPADDFPYDLAGGWTLSGGRNADGTEWEEADLQEALTLYGGMLQIVIDPNLAGTNEVVFQQGSGALYGYYEVINQEGIGMAFDNNGEEYRLTGRVTSVGEQLVMLVTSDQESYLYFAKTDEF